MTKPLWEKIRDWFKDFAEKLKVIANAYKDVEPDTVEGRFVAGMQDVIVALESLYGDTLLDASENFNAETQKNTAVGGVKYQAKASAKDPRVLDPRTATKSDVTKMLENVKAHKYAENTYIPIRISTPGIVQERLFAENRPIIMPVSKLLQAFSPDKGPVKGKNIRGHGFTVPQIVNIIEQMDSPDYIYSQEDGRGVEVIKMGHPHNDIVVVVEFDNNVNPAYMNGYEGGAYNVSVTMFNVDGGDIGLFVYKQDKGWHEVFNKQKEGDPAKKFPATRPFAVEQGSLKESVPYGGAVVNPKSSTRDPAKQKIKEALEQENAQLQEDVARFRKLLELQRTVTDGTKFTKTSVEAAARYLKKQANAKGDTKEFAGLLNTFYEKVASDAKPSWDKIKEYAAPVVKWLQDNVNLKAERSEYAQTILDQMRGSRIYLDENQRQEIAFEELVADAMETIPNDGNVLQMMVGVKERDKTLWEKIRDWFKDFAEKLKGIASAYKDVDPDTVEGRFVAGMQDVIVALESFYGDALLDASENFNAETQKNTATGGVRYSLKTFADGKRFVDVQMDEHTFDGMTVAEMNRIAKDILTDRFAGRVIGIDNRAFVNGDSVNEYLHPSKSIDIATRKVKLTASGELDNLIDAGIALPNELDGKDGHIHPDVIDFSYYKTIFKVGTEYFEGLINIKNIRRGKLLKDVTKIRNITQDIVSSYGQNPKSNFLRDASMNSIRNPDENVNTQSSTRDPTKQKIKEALEQENAQLQKDVARFRKLLELQRTVTDGTKFTKTSVEAAARYLKKQANAKGDTKEFAGLLNTFYEKVASDAKPSWDKIKEYAAPVVKWLQDNVNLKAERSEYAQNILNQMRGSRIYLDENQRQEAAYLSGSYNDFRKSL